jgi:hypothetical protein
VKITLKMIRMKLKCHASYKSDNVTEAIEHYNECKGWWTDLTGQTTAEIFQRAKTMENKQDVKQNKPRL